MREGFVDRPNKFCVGEHTRSMNLLLLTITTLIVLLFSLCILRLFYVFKFGGGHRKPKRTTSYTCGLAVFLGSGTKPGIAEVSS